MLYKVGKLDHSLCNCCWVTKFARKGLLYGEKVYERNKKAIFGILVLNLITQTVLTVLDQRFENQLYKDMPVDDILTHRNRVDFPLMAI